MKRKSKCAGFNYQNFQIRNGMAIKPSPQPYLRSPLEASLERLQPAGQSGPTPVEPKKATPSVAKPLRVQPDGWNQNNAFLVASAQVKKPQVDVPPEALNQTAAQTHFRADSMLETKLDHEEALLKSQNTTPNTQAGFQYDDEKDTLAMGLQKSSCQEGLEHLEGTLDQLSTSKTLSYPKQIKVPKIEM